jgi:hypothetical protein
VDDVELHGSEDFRHEGLRTIARDICRARWALVKALVLGRDDVESTDEEILRSWDRLFAQRDAVYAALADMARAEDAKWMANAQLPERFRLFEGARGAPTALARYVEHLLEQVEVMP